MSRNRQRPNPIARQPEAPAVVEQPKPAEPEKPRLACATCTLWEYVGTVGNVSNGKDALATIRVGYCHVGPTQGPVIAFTEHGQLRSPDVIAENWWCKEHKPGDKPAA